MSKDSVYRIGDIAEVFDGPHATPRKTETGPWFLSISSLKSGRLDLEESAHVSEEDFQKWTRRVTPQAGDVLFSYETRLGDAALMPDGVRACLGRRMAILRPRPDRVDSRFLLYAYLSADFQEQIRKRSIQGATVDRIPLTELPEWPIHLPDLATQKRVGQLVGALDDKIAVNERIMATSLELGKAQWRGAVDADSKWERISLGEAAKWTSGGTPLTSEPAYWGGDIPWISAASLKSPWIDDSERRITELGAQNGTRRVPANTVLFVVRGMSLKTEFRIGLTQREVAFGQDCKALVARDGIDPIVLFFAILDRTDEVLSMVDEAGHGTGRLSTDRLAKLEIPVPPDGVRSGIEARLRELSALAAARQRENRTLAQLRDALLPKLISGEIRIKDAEGMVEDAV